MSKSNRVNILKSKLSNASFYKLDCDIDNFEINKGIKTKQKIIDFLDLAESLQ